MKSSYKKEDVEILLKDITGKITPLSAAEREKKIQSGVHYSELLPLEYKPSKEYIALYEEALENHSLQTAQAVAVMAEKIWREKGENITLVSLARAGTPIGILVKRYLEAMYQVAIEHYTISIIRDKGIDTVAMHHILERHKPESVQFIDGWIGKGAITKELKRTMSDYPKVSDALAVLADPAGITNLYGTKEDFLIPSACLNAPVSGLFSRTVYNADIIKAGDFHGAVYYREMEPIDRSYEFIEKIQAHFPDIHVTSLDFENMEVSGVEEVQKIAKEFSVKDINFIKPGIGETTRVLMRRIPWKILVKDKGDSKRIGHILRLCKEKNIEIVEYPLKNYCACGIIKQMADI